VTSSRHLWRPELGIDPDAWHCFLAGKSAALSTVTLAARRQVPASGGRHGAVPPSHIACPAVTHTGTCAYRLTQGGCLRPGCRACMDLCAGLHVVFYGHERPFRGGRCRATRPWSRLSSHVSPLIIALASAGPLSPLRPTSSRCRLDSAGAAGLRPSFRRSWRLPTRRPRRARPARFPILSGLAGVQPYVLQQAGRIRVPRRCRPRLRRELVLIFRAPTWPTPILYDRFDRPRCYPVHRTCTVCSMGHRGVRDAVLRHC